MRLYIPATLADLTALEGLPARRAHAATAALARALGEEDSEVGEFSALQAAAADALDLLVPAADGPLVRVVVAAEVDDAPPAAQDEGPSAVLAPALPWPKVVSFHVDDPGDDGAQQVLRAAVGIGDGEADTGAEPGSGEAAAAVAELDLLWYDAGERAELLTWR